MLNINIGMLNATGFAVSAPSEIVINAMNFRLCLSIE
jgi:hypothetical protein